MLSPSLSQVNAVLEALTSKEPLIELLSVFGLAAVSKDMPDEASWMTRNLPAEQQF